MSQDPKDDTIPPIDPNDPSWEGWFVQLRTALADQDAVLRDLLRKKRKRDLGVREAKRLYRDARDKLRRLLARAGGGGGRKGGGGDGGDRGDPAGVGGSPAY